MARLVADGAFGSPASVVFAALLLKRTSGPALRWGGVAVAFLGAALLNFDPTVFAQGWALLFVATASCCYGLGTVLVRRLGRGWIRGRCRLGSR